MGARPATLEGCLIRHARLVGNGQLFLAAGIDRATVIGAANVITPSIALRRVVAFQKCASTLSRPTPAWIEGDFDNLGVVTSVRFPCF